MGQKAAACRRCMFSIAADSSEDVDAGVEELSLAIGKRARARAAEHSAGVAALGGRQAPQEHALLAAWDAVPAQTGQGNHDVIEVAVPQPSVK